MLGKLERQESYDVHGARKTCSLGGIILRHNRYSPGLRRQSAASVRRINYFGQHPSLRESCAASLSNSFNSS